MDIKTIPLGPIETNAFFVTHNQKAILIDAPHDAFKAISYLLENDGLELEGLFLTHGHWDHIADVHRFRQAYPELPVYMHKADNAWIEDPSLMNAISLPPEYHFPGTTVTNFLEQGQKLELLGKVCEVRHVPGHAPGNVLFYFGDDGVAFVGDALFAGGIGRTDLPGGDFKTLESSIRSQIYTLPAETTVYPGHGPSTTVGNEMSTNPYVSA